MNDFIPNLKVVTLNVWAIRYISKDIDTRIGHLIEALNKTNYDIVALQEVWAYNDFLRIKADIRHNYPYAHYFQSGLVGSGCCIFSKHYIQDVFYHKFSVNGYPHKIHHADWFAGKLVGLALINYHGIHLNVYVTHLHANYSVESQTHYHSRLFSDEYLSHRLTQLFELGQFIERTSQTSDMSILVGDLNTCDHEVGYKLLRHQANLLDALRERDSSGGNVSDNCATCHNRENTYQSSAAIRSAFPNGIRIDYILYKTQRDLDARCITCKNCLGKIEPLNLSYSDHEGVYAEFQLNRSSSQRTIPKDPIEPKIDYYLDTRSFIMRHNNSILMSQLFFGFAAMLSIVILFLFNDINPYLALVKNFLLTLVIFYCFIYIVFIKMIEKKHLQYTVDALSLAIDTFFVNLRNLRNTPNI